MRRSSGEGSSNQSPQTHAFGGPSSMQDGISRSMINAESATAYRSTQYVRGDQQRVVLEALESHPGGIDPGKRFAT
jgi:hypothetical protein